GGIARSVELLFKNLFQPGNIGEPALNRTSATRPFFDTLVHPSAVSNRGMHRFTTPGVDGKGRGTHVGPAVLGFILRCRLRIVREWPEYLPHSRTILSRHLSMNPSKIGRAHV